MNSLFSKWTLGVVIAVLVLAFNVNVNVNGQSNLARYDNYRLYRLHLQTDDHVKLFQELEERSDSYTFYGHALQVGQKLTIMVAAHKIAEISDILNRYGVPAEILVRYEYIGT